MFFLTLTNQWLCHFQLSSKPSFRSCCYLLLTITALRPYIWTSEPRIFPLYLARVLCVYPSTSNMQLRSLSSIPLGYDFYLPFVYVLTHDSHHPRRRFYSSRALSVCDLCAILYFSLISRSFNSQFFKLEAELTLVSTSHYYIFVSSSGQTSALWPHL